MYVTVAQGAKRGIVGLERGGGAGNWTKISTLLLTNFQNYFCA
jgi:hypothetical protein